MSSSDASVIASTASGLDRHSVVHSKKDLRLKVREIVQSYNQPALAQRFLPGREFNVGIVGGYSGTITSGRLRTGILPVSDPLAYLQPPVVGA